MFLRSFIIILVIFHHTTVGQAQGNNITMTYINGNHACQSEKEIRVLMHALKYDSSDGYMLAYELYEKEGLCWKEDGPAIKTNTFYTGVTLQEEKTGYVEFVVVEYISISNFLPFSILMYRIHTY